MKYLFYNNCVVLVYHRVVNLNSDPQLLSVSPTHFEEQIKYLKKNYKILSLQELIKCLQLKRVPHKSIVITFDDGYADNLYEAAPVLIKYRIPATIFISSGMIDANHPFWWDSLEHIFLSNEADLKKELQIEIGGTNRYWEIRNSNEAKDVYHELHLLIKSLPIAERNIKIDELYEWSGKQKMALPSHAVLSKQEVKRLAQLDNIEIGGHTISHPRLSNETLKVQEREISECKLNIEELIGKEVKSFSYPFGSGEDFSVQAVEIVKGSGYNCGIANIQAAVSNNTDVFKIPRKLVRNWTIQEFEKNMQLFFAKPHNWINVIQSQLKLK